MACTIANPLGISTGVIRPDQLTAADFHAHFGTSHELWLSGQGGGMAWAATAPHGAAHAQCPFKYEGKPADDPRKDAPVGQHRG